MEAAQLAELPHLTCQHLAVWLNGYPELKVSEKRGRDACVFCLMCHTCEAESRHWDRDHARHSTNECRQPGGGEHSARRRLPGHWYGI